MQMRFIGTLAGVIAVVLLFTVPVHAFDEGIEYRTLEHKQVTQSGEKVEVLEFFWYGCPHCYYLEPVLERWLARKPDYVEFRRLPAVLGRGWVNHARAYFAAQVLGVLDRLHIPFFRALHDQKQGLHDEASIADWFADQGVDREEFLRAYKSFIVDMNVRRAKQYGERVGLDSVPSFIVNGKFLTSPGVTAGSERMFELVDFLTAQEAGGASTNAPLSEAATASADTPAQQEQAGQEQAGQEQADEAPDAQGGPMENTPAK